MNEALAWELIHAVRGRSFGTENLSAILAVLLFSLDDEVNPAWESIFRISVSEAGVEDDDFEDDDVEATLADPSWPVIKVYVPCPEIWNVCGFGSAGVVQKQPDGLLSLTMFELSLIDGGVMEACHEGDLTPRQMEDFLEGVGHHLHPWQEGPPDLASRYIWEPTPWILRKTVGKMTMTSKATWQWCPSLREMKNSGWPD